MPLVEIKLNKKLEISEKEELKEIVEFLKNPGKTFQHSLHLSPSLKRKQLFCNKNQSSGDKKTFLPEKFQLSHKKHTPH